jgi:hypothetical protein
LKVPQYLSQDFVQLVQHFVVPEAHHAKSALRENGAARRVKVDLISMLTAIDPNDQARLDADEVDDEAVDRNLPAKLESAQAARTQARPRQALHIRSACTQ